MMPSSVEVQYYQESQGRSYARPIGLLWSDAEHKDWDALYDTKSGFVREYQGRWKATRYRYALMCLVRQPKQSASKTICNQNWSVDGANHLSNLMRCTLLSHGRDLQSTWTTNVRGCAYLVAALWIGERKMMEGTSISGFDELITRWSPFALLP
ncbi:hypothetical protein VNO80_16092 [Phaseolus coccineus]|uniref:Uncharacterized protein n=1 Tax=Phaseolus coccineus TaxID=3886 RepID=A0AAN9MQ60_PHACN